MQCIHWARFVGGISLNIGISKETAEMIFNNHTAYVFRVALFLTKSKVMADDITQETFLHIFSKYHTYDTRRPIEPWIYKITLNTTRNALRKQRWLSFMDQLPEHAACDDTENIILRNEEEVTLWAAVDLLTHKSKEVIVLHYYSDMKLSDVADTLGIPLGTCKSRLNTALRNLYKQLAHTNFILGGLEHE
ncbi:MAG: polymerase ECF-type sigma factor [Clostridia bacterium]|jgi:RNA polymerase sigma-70 factor (ECF subfamily)|nr:polymerase ECF-type sigma factor [Clostridia bacterium]MDF2879089.1 polymerase ECF-type sigma factor [Clostridia bacterium]